MDYTWLIVIVAVPAMISLRVYLLVLRMSEPGKMLRPIEGSLSPARQQILIDHKEWLAARGFQYLTSFQFSKIQVAVFQQENPRRYISFNFLSSWNCDLITHFDDSRSLTTSSSGAIGMFPISPGSYKQGFPNVSADVLWQRHLEAEDYLAKKFGVTPKALAMPYEEHVVKDIREQMAYVRSIPLWPIRALFWFAVNRGRMANRSVQQQYP